MAHKQNKQIHTSRHFFKSKSCFSINLTPQFSFFFDRMDKLVFFFYNNVVYKIQTIFTTNKIKRNNYNKTEELQIYVNPPRDI